MHDLLLSSEPPSDFVGLSACAARIGLHMSRFELDLRQGIHAAKVWRDYLSGLKSGVTGVPAFFNNDRTYCGEVDVDDLLEAIERAGADSEP